MTPQQLEVLALLYNRYSSNGFVFKGKRGSACQMLYDDYARNPYREMLNLKVDDNGSNLKGEFVLKNLIDDTNFIVFLREELYFGEKIRYYKLTEEGEKIGRLVTSKDPENIELARQVTKKYNGEVAELPVEFYKAEIEKKNERIYFLENKIKEFMSFLKRLKELKLDVIPEIDKKIKEYKV